MAAFASLDSSMLDFSETPFLNIVIQLMKPYNFSFSQLFFFINTSIKMVLA